MSEVNPYGSPQSEDSDIEQATSNGAVNLLLRSRRPVYCVASYLGFVATMSLLAFAYQVIFYLPGEGWYFLQNPLTVMGHFIRALGCGVVAWRLSNYATALKRFESSTQLPTALAECHFAAWKAGAILVIVLFLFGIVTIANTLNLFFV